MAVVRGMRFEDLGGVCVVQCSAYPPHLLEHPHTFLAKLVKDPVGCFVAAGAGGRIIGYVQC